MTRNTYNGKCTRCRTFFVGMSKDEYTSAVTAHLNAMHDGADPTDVIERV